MKQNRAHRVIEILDKAPNKTLTLIQLCQMMGTDWSPRAINEARKIPGVQIDGHNPYTLITSPTLPKKPIRYEFVGNTAIPIYQ